MGLTEDIITFPIGRLAERNPSSFTVAGVLEGLGIRVPPLDFRFAQVVSQLKGWSTFGLSAQRPLFSMGTEHTGRGIRSFHHQLKKIQPHVGISITPSEIVESWANIPMRARHFWIDSSAVGDVLGGCWDVFHCTRMTPVLSTVWYAAGMTLAARYEEMIDGSEPGPPGALRRYAIAYAEGAVQEIATLAQVRSFRVLSRNSQLAAKSLCDVWKQEIFPPVRKTTQTRPTMVAQIVIFRRLGEMGKVRKPRPMCERGRSMAPTPQKGAG